MLKMTFPNRTAREKGFLACPACGLEEEQAAVAEAIARGNLPPSPAELQPTRVGGGQVMGRMLAGTALLGIALGIAIGTLIRRH